MKHARNGETEPFGQALHALRRRVRTSLRLQEQLLRNLEELDFRLEELEDRAWHVFHDIPRLNGSSGRFEDLSPQARAALRRTALVGGLSRLEILRRAPDAMVFRIDGNVRLLLPRALGEYLALVAAGGGEGPDLWGRFLPLDEVSLRLGCSHGALKTRTWRLRSAFWAARINPYYLEVERQGVRLRLRTATVVS